MGFCQVFSISNNLIKATNHDKRSWVLRKFDLSGEKAAHTAGNQLTKYHKSDSSYIIIAANLEQCQQSGRLYVPQGQQIYKNNNNKVTNLSI